MSGRHLTGKSITVHYRCVGKGLHHKENLQSTDNCMISLFFLELHLVSKIKISLTLQACV